MACPGYRILAVAFRARHGVSYLQSQHSGGRSRAITKFKTRSYFKEKKAFRLGVKLPSSSRARILGEGCSSSVV